MAKAWNSTLNRGTSTLKRSPLNPVNRERQERVADRKWGPGGASGPWAVVLRARPCDTCGRGRGVPRSRWEDLERLALSPQSEISHVIARGAGAEPRVPAVGYTISNCVGCHLLVTDAGGFGPTKDAALKLAAALAWEALDHGLIDDDPEVPRPARSVAECQVILRELWTDWMREER